MKKITTILLSIFSVLTLATSVTMVAASPASAQIDVFKQCTGDAAASAVCKGGGKLFGEGSIWNRILTTLTFITGAVAVLMIVIGGLRYTLSGGDEKAIGSAKNTILYAAIGLIVSVMANAIVNFVLINI